MSTETIRISENTDLLVENCKKGDDSAYRELYMIYNKAMYNVCLRMLNNREEAQDVLQESFISAFKNIKQYHGKASFGSWLKRIVINRCIDEIKKRNPRLVSLELNDVVDEVEEVEPEMTYTIDQIREAIVLLPDGFRIIINLYLFEDYTHKMIAEKLKISEGTSKSQYSRAKKRLLSLINKPKS